MNILQLNEAIAEFEDVLSEERERIVQEYKNEPKNDRVVNQEMVENLKKLRMRLESERKPVQVVSNPVNDKFKSWAADYTKLKMDQGRLDHLVKVDGKLMDATEYLEYRLKNEDKNDPHRTI